MRSLMKLILMLTIVSEQVSTAAFSQTPTVQPVVQSAPLANIWWVPIVSALIGVISALATPFVKDLYIQRRNDRIAHSENQREIFRNYAAPLVSASEKLIWRFSEIFLNNNGQWLKTDTLPFVYCEYQRKSTLYRIACVLGWIRAIYLELSALPRGGLGLSWPISDAIGDFQGALADGRNVEIRRLTQLCSVWHFKLDHLEPKEVDK
jgi:hypothetical protein